MSEAPRVLIIHSDYYREIGRLLREGTESVLADAGAQVDFIEVAGALELPGALAMAVLGKAPYDGFVLLGCVIRGETSHYDVVVNEAARGTMELITRHGLAVGFGLLTVENQEQALVRADAAKKDHGGHAARAVLAQIDARRRLST